MSNDETQWALGLGYTCRVALAEDGEDNSAWSEETHRAWLDENVAGNYMATDADHGTWKIYFKDQAMATLFRLTFSDDLDQVVAF